MLEGGCGWGVGMGRVHLEEDPVDEEAEGDYIDQIADDDRAVLAGDVEDGGPRVAREDAEERHKRQVEPPKV